MTTIQTTAFEINGVIDTSRSVLDNLNTLCTASGSWLTYDVTTGLWSVVINKAGSSVMSFNDTNIIGNINVSGTGINEAYNKVTVDFPHKDLRDQRDYIDLVIPLANRYPNEIDNTMAISFDIINDPVQAQYIGQIELKQTRVDKVIEFRTDYSVLGLRAGDIIDVTAEMYGYDQKKFRVTKISEEDTDGGSLELSIQALEYDESIYDSSGLVREQRTKKTGIIPKSMNSALTNSDNQAQMTNLTNGLNNPANALLALTLGNALTSSAGISSRQSCQYTTVTSTGYISGATPPFSWQTIFGKTEAAPAFPDDVEIYHISANFNWAGVQDIANQDPTQNYQTWKNTAIKIMIGELELHEFIMFYPYGSVLSQLYQSTGWTADIRGAEGYYAFGTGGGLVGFWEDHILDVICIIPKGVSWTIQSGLNYTTDPLNGGVINNSGALVTTTVTPIVTEGWLL